MTEKVLARAAVVETERTGTDDRQKFVRAHMRDFVAARSEVHS
jgi:hypothetical protein